MANQREGTKQQGTQKPAQGKGQTPIADLDSRPDDAERVKGGRRRVADPCDGGE